MRNISVVICAWKRSTILVYQLRAVLEQLKPGDEIVLMDDGSGDGTVQEAVAQVNNDERINLIVNPTNVGVTASRNIGVKNAKHDFLAFCDNDDIVAPDWLDRVREHLEEHPFIGCNLDIVAVNDPGSMSSVPASPTANGLPVWDGGFRYVIGAGFGLRREVWEAVGGFDEKLGSHDDVDFSIRATIAGYEPYFAEDAIVYYRLRSTLKDIYKQNRGYGASAMKLKKKLMEESPEFREALEREGETEWQFSGPITPERIARALGSRAGRRQVRREQAQAQAKAQGQEN
ncbi:glycosyltransferase family 2 protein [Corynebacterium glaucum]|uniref:glycosyltransferase family 2 protein n=1 Tax=Corynebacterium glaucum TaxID=187491 RepID=UPI00265AC374|nr:glycosyltransferase [Corynebacterium glaucum]